MITTINITEEKIRKLALSVFESFSTRKISSLENRFLEAIGLIYEDDGNSFRVISTTRGGAVLFSMSRHPSESDWNDAEKFFSEANFEIENGDAFYGFEDGVFELEITVCDGGYETEDGNRFSFGGNEFSEALENLSRRKLSDTEYFLLEAHKIALENDGSSLKVFRVNSSGEKEERFSVSMNDDHIWFKVDDFFNNEDFFYY